MILTSYFLFLISVLLPKLRMEFMFFIKRLGFFDLNLPEVAFLMNDNSVLFDQFQHCQKSHNRLIFVSGPQQAGKKNAGGFLIRETNSLILS